MHREIKRIIQDVYKEAIAQDYSGCREEKQACLDWLYAQRSGATLDLCGDGRTPNGIIPSTGEMHKFLEHTPRMFDTILVRHVFEHSVMPYVLLRLLKRALRKDGKIILVVPENNEFIANFPNHYGVFDRTSLEALFKKAGFTHRWWGRAFFGSHHDKIEWRYELT